MSCKYKYKDNWYSKDEIKEILLKERGINSKGELIKPTITNNPKQAKITKENTTSIESVKNKIKEDDISEETYLLDNDDKEIAKAREERYQKQALINFKIAALKEVARKYPRSLITSKVVPIDKNLVQSGEVQYSKIPSAKDLQNEISEYLQGMDESIALEYDNLLSSQKQQAIEYYIEKQQNQSQKFSLAEKLEAPCEGGPNI